MGDKTTTIDEAVATFVIPGALVYVDRNAGAALRAVLRRYTGHAPAFSLAVAGVTNYVVNVVAAGLVERLITTSVTHTYPRPGPVRPIQQAVAAGVVDVELWTSLSFVQRLAAAAMGLPFFPSPSVARSELAENNPEAYSEVTDPFDPTAKRVGVVRPLRPDVAIVHACAADCHGNAILPVPYEDLVWGTRASRTVILTTERIVSEDLIRRYPALVKIPGHRVAAVAEAPFGAHPNGLICQDFDGFVPYRPDLEFLAEHRRAARDLDSLRAWTEEWVLSIPDHSTYLQRLGNLSRLQAPELFFSRPTPPAADHSSPEGGCADATAVERLIVAAATLIAERVRTRSYRVVLAGIGVSALAAWLAYYQLRRYGIDVNVVEGWGLYGYCPQPGIPMTLVNPANLVTASMITDTLDLQGVIIGGRPEQCLAVLGAGQVDQHGNLNTTIVGGELLTGGGGGPDAAVAADVVVVTTERAARFVPTVEHVTTPGHNVTALVTESAIFRKGPGGDLLRLASILSEDDDGEARQRLDAAMTGWGWATRDDTNPVGLEARPDPADIALLRTLDPGRLYLGAA